MKWVRQARAVSTASLIRTVVISAAAILATACAPDGNPRAGPSLPDGVTAELIAEGEGIFLKEGYCYICHDRDGSGGMGADLVDDEWWHSDGSYGGIVGTILSGVDGEQSVRGPQSTMPPKGGTQITDAQVLAVAAYVWSLRLPTDVPAPR